MKKQKTSLGLNKNKISNLNKLEVMGGRTRDCESVGCTRQCGPTEAGCTTPITQAPTCTLQTVDLSYCGSGGTLPDPCESNQVCA
jgi:hypothetical protein